jgi:hypothetical protein
MIPLQMLFYILLPFIVVVIVPLAIASIGRLFQ